MKLWLASFVAFILFTVWWYFAYCAVSIAPLGVLIMLGGFFMGHVAFWNTLAYIKKRWQAWYLLFFQILYVPSILVAAFFYDKYTWRHESFASPFVSFYSLALIVVAGAFGVSFGVCVHWFRERDLARKASDDLAST